MKLVMNYFLFSAIKGHPCHSEYLVLPESKKMAQTYCSALCNLSGICEYFMTTEESKCPRNCNIKENISECMLIIINLCCSFQIKILFK